MKYKIEILGLLLLTMIQSCVSNNQTDKLETELFEKYSNDSIRSLIFKIAYENKSTSPSYIVYKAKDLNTGIIKEICCEVPFLSGAMHRELNIDYNGNGIEYIDSIILANRLKTFEFKNKDALNNINFGVYPDKETIDRIASKKDLDYYYEKFGTNDSIKFMHFENDSGFEQESFAHIMFKIGIITSRDCMAGNNIWFGDPNISMPKVPIIDE